MIEIDILMLCKRVKKKLTEAHNTILVKLCSGVID